MKPKFIKIAPHLIIREDCIISIYFEIIETKGVIYLQESTKESPHLLEVVRGSQPVDRNLIEQCQNKIKGYYKLLES